LHSGTRDIDHPIGGLLVDSNIVLLILCDREGISAPKTDEKDEDNKS
jgi:hypothetical protein